MYLIILLKTPTCYVFLFLLVKKAKTRGKDFFVRPVELWSLEHFTKFCLAMGIAANASDIMNYYLQNIRKLIIDGNVVFVKKARQLEKTYKKVRHRNLYVVGSLWCIPAPENFPLFS